MGGLQKLKSYNTLKLKTRPKQIWAVILNVTSARIMTRPGAKTARNNSLENFSLAEPCPFHKNITYSQRFEFKPYVLADGISKKTLRHTPGKKIGADLNYNITPSLKLNLTVNYRFLAQVGADIIQVNLTPFHLYYPEKKGLFPGGAGNLNLTLAIITVLFIHGK